MLGQQENQVATAVTGPGRCNAERCSHAVDGCSQSGGWPAGKSNVRKKVTKYLIQAQDAAERYLE